MVHSGLCVFSHILYLIPSHFTTLGSATLCFALAMANFFLLKKTENELAPCPGLVGEFRKKHCSRLANTTHRTAQQSLANMSKDRTGGMSAADMKAAAARAPFFRLRFADGYVFREVADNEEELTRIAANHYWWGEEKPSVDELSLTIRSRRNVIFYLVEADGYPKNINTTDDF